MPILAERFRTNVQGAIYQVFNTYGDTIQGRTVATQVLRNLLRLFYGEAYDYIIYGNSVENGLITKAFVDRYNFLISAAGGSLSNSQAIAQIEASGSVNITFVTPENPSYQYPWYYEYRVPPFNTLDRFTFNPLGVQNHKYNGSKLSGDDINIDSTETVDGGPVVKITKVNQNQIVFSNNNITTARSNTSGLPARQLTSRTTAGGTGTISNTITEIPANEA